MLQLVQIMLVLLFHFDLVRVKDVIVLVNFLLKLVQFHLAVTSKHEGFEQLVAGCYMLLGHLLQLHEIVVLLLGFI